MTTDILILAVIAFPIIGYFVACKQGRRTPSLWALSTFLLSPLGLLIFLLPLPSRPLRQTTGRFELKGFTMNTTTGMFTVDEREYHKSAVRDVKWEKTYLKDGATEILTIVLNDMRYPVHKLHFTPVYPELEGDFERLKMLLCS